MDTFLEGPELARQRRWYGVSAARLAARIGVSGGRVSAIERSRRVTPTWAARYLSALQELDAVVRTTHAS